MSNAIILTIPAIIKTSIKNIIELGKSLSVC